MRQILIPLTLTVVLALFFSGCQTTGGTSNGQLPAPKILEGKIEDNVYYAPDGSFTVRVPHDQGTYEYKYMAVKEQKDDLGPYVSFGPAAYDQSIYRIKIWKHLVPESASIPFEKSGHKALDYFKPSQEEAYGTPVEELAHGETIVNGRQALTWEFSQQVPSRMTPQGETAEMDLRHIAYAIDGPNAIAVIWVQATGWAAKPVSDDVLMGNVNKFIESFRFQEQ